MKGKDGKTLEERVMDIFGKIEEARKESDNIREEIRNIEKKIKKHYQKVGIVRYNAFEGMEGNLSFALTVLDENDNGWLFDSMNTERENHNFIKEIIKGESYIELTDEEKESLERAIFQEVYDIRYMDNLP
jgi:ABC-type enterochelin transport system substrate-binding protein